RRALFSLPACLAGFVLLGLASLLAQAQTITTTVGTGATPSAVAINPVTNKIYVANMHSNNVTVIDGASNTATTVNVGQAPTALAVNSVTNKIYVANGQGNSNTVTVIDGATNATLTLSLNNPLGRTNPVLVAVNPVTNKIYVADSNNVLPEQIAVID